MMKHVKNVLALLFVAPAGEYAHWTSAKREVRDEDGVDIAFAASDLQSLARTVGTVSVAVLFDIATALKNTQLLLAGPLKEVLVPFRQLIMVAAKSQ